MVRPALRGFILAGGLGLLLLALHLWVTRGTGELPAAVADRFGASAGTVASRPWAQATAMWLHGSWGHLAYNLIVLMATMPFAIAAFGDRAVGFALVSSPLAGFAVNLLIILPLAGVWGYAASAVEPRLVGASLFVFAGAGIAWVAWTGPAAWKAAALLAFVAYEIGLAALGMTRPFVGGYHIAGALLGIGWGLAMTRP